VVAGSFVVVHGVSPKLVIMMVVALLHVAVVGLGVVEVVQVVRLWS
jgi:hypothetical protein